MGKNIVLLVLLLAVAVSVFVVIHTYFQQPLEQGGKPQAGEGQTGDESQAGGGQAGGEQAGEAPSGGKVGYRLEDARFGILQQYRVNDPRVINLGAVWDRPAGPGDTPFRWGAIERRKGEYDWSEPDRYVKWCAENGKLPIAMIFPYAEWDQVEGYGKYCERAPHDMEAYKRFVKLMVERYDGDGVDDMPGLKQPVKYWEVMNEVVPRPWGEKGEIWGFFNGTAEEYFKILKITYEAIKEADPEAKVLVAGIADMTIGNECKEFYSKVFKLGGAKYFDIANIHWIYNVKAFKEFLSAHNVSKPIWVTETEFMQEWAKPYAWDAESSVWSIVRTFGLGVEKIVLCPGVASSSRTGYRALKTMIAVLNYFDKVEKIGDNCYKFTGKLGVTYVIRNSSLPKEVSEKLDKMNVFNLTGEPVELNGDYVESLIYVSDLSPPSFEEVGPAQTGFLAIPVYPEATPTKVPDEVWRDVGVPSKANRSAYLVYAKVKEVAKWYDEKMGEWVLEDEVSHYDPSSGSTELVNTAR